jgi:ribosomal protein L11 methyltransferase
MNWKTFAAGATRDSLEQLEQLFWDAGAVSVTVEDGGRDPLFEPGPGEMPIWESVVVTGMFEDDVDTAIVRDLLERNNFSLMLADELGDRDWEREWLTRFKPMKFGEHVWVCPTGFEVDEPEAVVIQLDPGLAFGTGTHPTTRLCLQFLDGHVRSGQQILDFGCGSGILGIAALLLGARKVVAVDNDPQALTATKENAERNGVEDRLALFLPEQEPEERYAIVVANILAKPLIDLSALLQSRIAGGGLLVLSGIMLSQLEWVVDAYPSISFEAPVVEDDWVCIAGRKIS